MKIKYNSPVILTYSIISICVLTICSNEFAAQYFSSPSSLSFTNPSWFLRLISYIAVHSGLKHLMGNLMIILLIGPLLEEKYGSVKLLVMILITAVTTGLLNAVLFSNSLIGGSGIAFMLILLGSFSNIRSKEIPLTFILIAILFVGSEIISTLKVDQVSQFSHLVGGFIGAAYGFIKNGKR
jgi:membrane associated rhomboid family serine protease